jgi:nucleotide-binding universal stress UspA family protein
MLTLRTILCPVDFSEQSQHALHWAVALAARYQSRLTVLTAVDPLLAEAARARLKQDLVKTETEPALREFVTGSLPATAGWLPEVVYSAQVGDPSQVILEAADRQQADLIVLGTHGLGGFRKFLLGSTTERVLRRTKTAILAVPPMKAQSIILDAEGARLDIHRILMGVDFTEGSDAAVKWAADLAQELTLPLVLCHVVSPVVVPAQFRSYVVEVDEEQARHAQLQLETLSRQFKGTVAYETFVPIGRPADALASTAEERNAGLIVVGLMGQKRPDAPRPGSIAYRVLCLAHVPVLIVPPHVSAEAAVSTAPNRIP